MQIDLSENKLKCIPYNIIDVCDDIYIIMHERNSKYTNKCINISKNPFSRYLKYEIITKEILINGLRHYVAINKIGNQYLTAKYDPQYQMCKDKVNATFADTLADTFA